MFGVRRSAFVVLVVLLTAAPIALPRDYPIRAVPMTAVTIDDGFWKPKLEINRTVTIPHILKENDDTGRVANFEAAHESFWGLEVLLISHVLEVLAPARVPPWR